MSAKIRGAIALFAQVQRAMGRNSEYLEKPAAKQKLLQVLALAPQHLSAQLLLDEIEEKQPKKRCRSPRRCITPGWLQETC